MGRTQGFKAPEASYDISWDHQDTGYCSQGSLSKGMKTFHTVELAQIYLHVGRNALQGSPVPPSSLGAIIPLPHAAPAHKSQPQHGETF